MTTRTPGPAGTEPYDVEECPYCGETSGVKASPDTPPRVRAWSCGDCGTDWAVTVVNPHLRSAATKLAAAVQEISRLRGTLRQVLALADDAPTLTDEQLRTRLLALAGKCGAR